MKKEILRRGLATAFNDLTDGAGRIVSPMGTILSGLVALVAEDFWVDYVGEAVLLLDALDAFDGMEDSPDVMAMLAAVGCPLTSPEEVA